MRSASPWIAARQSERADLVRFGWDRSCWRATLLTAMGGLLIVAAILKSRQLITYPSSAFGFWASLALICCEVHLGAWLLLARTTAATRWIAIAAFVWFACVSAAKWMTGADSCGCFGVVAVKPWITLSIDGFAVLALVACKPAIPRETDAPVWPRLRRLLPYSLAACAGIALVAMASQRNFAFPGLDGEITSNVILLEPEKWEGHQFPLLRSVQIAADLSRGEWDLMPFGVAAVLDNAAWGTRPFRSTTAEVHLLPLRINSSAQRLGKWFALSG